MGGILTPGTVFDEREVSLYYSRKTADILYKYGPGPRVHFHVGLFDSDPNTTVPQRVIRQRLIDSQEAVLDHAARSWRVAHDPPARVLDIGCGLGGGSLDWAQRYGSIVTGLTVTAEHVPIVVDFARQAGVADLVGAELGDIHELRDERVYDAAVAIESSGYMDRERLFSVVAKALKPSGWFGIQEHFLRRPEWAGFLDSYYKTHLGTITDYLSAAHAAGFELEQDEDITDGVAEFWVQSMAWTTTELDKPGQRSPITRERLTESALTHGKLFRIWRDHAVETRQLKFRLAA
jgi:tocopherol O-methyltransferase